MPTEHFLLKNPVFHPLISDAISLFMLAKDCLSKVAEIEDSSIGRWSFRNKSVFFPFSKPVDPLQYRFRV